MRGLRQAALALLVALTPCVVAPCVAHADPPARRVGKRGKRVRAQESPPETAAAPAVAAPDVHTARGATTTDPAKASPASPSTGDAGASPAGPASPSTGSAVASPAGPSSPSTGSGGASPAGPSSPSTGSGGASPAGPSSPSTGSAGVSPAGPSSPSSGAGMTSAQRGAPGATPDMGATAAGAAATPAAQLTQHLALLEQKKLAPAPATRVEELEEVLEAAHQRTLLGRGDEATLLMLEAVEGPRFRAFEGLPTFAAAELMLSSLLLDQHALRAAQRHVESLLARNDAATFGPGYRRAVDIALARGDYAASAAHLQELVSSPLPADAADELRYLRALAARDARDQATLVREASAVTNKSRFFARAQYLLGALAAERGEYDEADARFRTVRDILGGFTRTRYASPQLDPTEDLAQLGRARIAHERGANKQANALYFAIPNDSAWLPEALFESAYASYERGKPELALDSLAQLEARYPHSPYTAEARVLRGYVHLANCDFERAERELTEFEQTFGGVLRELDASLESSGRTHGLFRERALGPTAASDHEALLRGLIARDPTVERIQRELAQLDAELARGGSLDGELEALAARVRGKELPRTRHDEDAARVQALREQSVGLRDALLAFGDELRALKRGGAKAEELAELERTRRTLTTRSDRVEAALRALRRQQAGEAPPPSGVELGQRLDEERRYAAVARGRAQDLHARLEEALAEAERAALTRLRGRVEGELRRARIGRVDAVMGKKRKLELEIESLHAGRFPPELASRTHRSEYLRDDEEYWPFEGEDWADEPGPPARERGPAREREPEPPDGPARDRPEAQPNDVRDDARPRLDTRAKKQAAASGGAR